MVAHRDRAGMTFALITALPESFDSALFASVDPSALDLYLPFLGEKSEERLELHSAYCPDCWCLRGCVRNSNAVEFVVLQVGIPSLVAGITSNWELLLSSPECRASKG